MPFLMFTLNLVILDLNALDNDNDNYRFGMLFQRLVLTKNRHKMDIFKDHFTREISFF